ncbi:MAG: nitrate/nitrite transporter NrtS [Pseudomonadales bacterium]
MNTKIALRAIFSGAHLRRAIVVAVVVGTALNVINQPEVLFSGAAPHWGKLLLTYCVPFLVASYGAFAALRDSERG